MPDGLFVDKYDNLCNVPVRIAGMSTRIPPLWPGFDSQTWRHMWVEFVGSLLCSERFLTFDLICVNR